MGPIPRYLNHFDFLFARPASIVVILLSFLLVRIFPILVTSLPPRRFHLRLCLSFKIVHKLNVDSRVRHGVEELFNNPIYLL